MDRRHGLLRRLRLLAMTKGEMSHHPLRSCRAKSRHPAPRASRLRSRRTGFRFASIGSVQLPLPAERIAVHHLDALGGEFVADRIGGGEILVRAGLLAAGDQPVDFGLGRSRPRPGGAADPRGSARAGRGRAIGRRSAPLDALGRRRSSSSPSSVSSWVSSHRGVEIVGRSRREHRPLLRAQREAALGMLAGREFGLAACRPASPAA